MDDLKSEDVGARTEAVSRLHTIALALGPERSRSELLPFCKESLLEEEDEVLSSLAANLNRDFVDLIGGLQHMDLLVPLYESLLSSEEAAVRVDCISSLKTILPDAAVKDTVRRHFFPVFQRLSAVDEWFTKKSSAAAIAPLLVHHLNEGERDKMGAVFQSSLLADDNPIVRRAALSACKTLFSSKASVGDCTQWLRYISPLIDDAQDSVRLLLVDPVALLGQHMPHDAQVSAVFPLALRLIGDHSWRVRFMAATGYAELMKGVGLSVPDFQPLVAFSGLLTDYEAEVRVAAAGQIAAVAALWPLPETFSVGLLPVLQRIVVDPNPAVRAALALQLNELSAVAGKEATMSELLPLFLQLFQDDSSQVRLNVISRLDVINAVIGVEHLSQALVPAITKLTEDSQWTVRQAIIDYIPVVSAHLGVDFFNSQLLTVSIGLLDDAVYAVRQAAIHMLLRIGQSFGREHFETLVLPAVRDRFSSHPNYLRRITYLMALARCCEIVDKIDAKLWLPSLEALSLDPIANVRMNAAKTAAKLAAASAGILERLRNDADEDVRFFANGNAVADVDVDAVNVNVNVDNTNVGNVNVDNTNVGNAPSATEATTK